MLYSISHGAAYYVQQSVVQVPADRVDQVAKAMVVKVAQEQGINLQEVTARQVG